ncbi:MAG: hypothetical protein JNJ73_14020 [Hyphomonadaceae bacterium]|nr:hypothetical protein [Hyphomonadaceae bacterium]
MRAFVFGLVLTLLAACASTRPAPPAAKLDSIAHDYVRLVLEIGAHEEGYIDAYYGPPELKTAAEAHPRSLADLREAADRLLVALEDMDYAALQPLEKKRRFFLMSHIASAEFRTRMIEGERVPFAQEANRMLGVAARIEPLSSYDPVLARIETLVPGRGPLAERVEAFRRRYIIPRDRLDAVMRAAIAECRARTAAHIALPEGEAFTLEFVTNQPWSGYNWFQGGAKSLIQINTDLPIFIDRAVDLGCHEGYPGHHTHHALMEQRLYRGRGWIEVSVYPLFSPSSFIAEGEGNYGVDLAFPGEERTRFEAEVLFPLAGLDPAAAPAYAALRRALKDLTLARIKIAQMYLDGEIDRPRALELSQRYRLISPERAAQDLSFMEKYRSYVINYGLGEIAVREHIERAGADPAARWAAMYELLSSPSLPSDLR